MAIRHTTAIGAAVALFCLHNAAYADVQAGVEAWRGGDYAQAVSEWQPLAEAGDPDAQFNLGQAYKLGRGVPQDMGRARDLFGLAAAQGHLQADANYGLILFQEGNREQAMPYIVRAAEAGEPRAQYIYGTALFNGDLAPRDWPRAYALMTNASEAGIPQASASLQQMDVYIPIEQREQGREMATQMAAANPTTPVGVSPPPVPAPASAPVVAAAPAVTPTPAPSSTFTPVEVPPPVAAPPVSPPVAVPPVSAPPVQVAAPAPAPVPAPVINVPSSPVGTTTAAPAARTGDWRIQLGAFSERPRAEALWRRLANQSSALAALQPYLVRAGTLTRLQAGPFQTRAEAQRACRSAAQAGSECITVRRR
ncbi:hypothetical protein HFP51_03075 [Parasphingopyxis sp. CP4]|uniref:SPOR domain-containing protein n=1 Tax=Parasphingopyxis sp. CP4 TaxID=2724527 RepID=UPI0015A09C65|nr:SPOR domain-containing protein [Parasphingopyxis sp. CP4]QLC21256.1 hypothetical protein HFP51_03075 [Parasphingopyxis sp. CP4]